MSYKTSQGGFNLELELAHQTETDWLVGSESTTCRAIIPIERRVLYLPDGEVQYGAEDFMDCATRSPINELETKFNFLDRENKLTKEELAFLSQYRNPKNGRIEFSDRFIAVLSGTTRQGNSLKAPVDAIHSYGLIPKSLLPASSSMTFAEYHNPDAITAKMKAIGREFKTHFGIFYERFSISQYEEIVKEDMVGLAGYAWPIPINGEYPRSEGGINHAFMAFGLPKSLIFDNYLEDGTTDDYIKKLAPDYIFLDYGYRVYIGPGEDTDQTILLLMQYIELLKEYLNLLKNHVSKIGSIFRPNRVWKPS